MYEIHALLFVSEHRKKAVRPNYRNMVDFRCGTLFGIFDLSEDEIFK